MEKIERKKMTKEELLEMSIEMPSIYINLTSDEKNENTYRNKLDDVIIDVCTNHYKIKRIESVIWFCDDYNIQNEFKYKRYIIDISNILKDRFKYYKKKEKNYIEEDKTLSLSTKNKLKKIVDNAFKNTNEKIDILVKGFQNDIDALKLYYKDHECCIIEDKADIEILKSQAIQMKQDIEDYCKQIVCNKKDTLKSKNLKPLTSAHTEIVAKTILENSCEINVAIQNSDLKKIGQIFIKSFNEKIELEKIKGLQN
jgi:hypothetical protein